MRPRLLKLKSLLWMESLARPQRVRMLRPYHLTFTN